jgi:hypothetical protein
MAVLPPLFREDGRMTEEGRSMAHHVGRQLSAQFKARERPQEVAALIYAVVEELRCETILERSGG